MANKSDAPKIVEQEKEKAQPQGSDKHIETQRQQKQLEAAKALSQQATQIQKDGSTDRTVNSAINQSHPQLARVENFKSKTESGQPVDVRMVPNAKTGQADVYAADKDGKYKLYTQNPDGNYVPADGKGKRVTSLHFRLSTLPPILLSAQMRSKAMPILPLPTNLHSSSANPCQMEEKCRHFHNRKHLKRQRTSTQQETRRMQKRTSSIRSKVCRSAPEKKVQSKGNRLTIRSIASSMLTQAISKTTHHVLMAGVSTGNAPQARRAIQIWRDYKISPSEKMRATAALEGHPKGD